MKQIKPRAFALFLCWSIIALHATTKIFDEKDNLSRSVCVKYLSTQCLSWNLDNTPRNRFNTCECHLHREHARWNSSHHKLAGDKWEQETPGAWCVNGTVEVKPMDYYPLSFRLFFFGHQSLQLKFLHIIQLSVDLILLNISVLMYLLLK